MLAVMEELGGFVNMWFAACALGWVFFLLILFALVRWLESGQSPDADGRTERPVEGNEKGS